MALIWGALWLLAAPVAAECLGPGHLPTKLIFESGAQVDIISRRAGDLTYVTRTAQGRATVSVLRLGVFHLSSETDGKEFRRARWTDPLIAPEDLEPGRVQIFHGHVTLDGLGEDIPMMTGLQVIGHETLVVQDCPYEVLVLDRKEVALGPKRAVFETRFWYAPDLGLALANQPKAGDRPKQVVVSLE